MPMKKMKTLISTALCLCTMCALALPAHALEYNISAPGDPEYGKPTSFEPVVTADGGTMKNEDVSKNAALIPPGFGTPTSYVLNTGEYLTPNLVPSQMQEISAQPIRIFLDFNAVIVNLDSLPLDIQKSCIANIEKNVQELKSYLEENLQQKENVPEVPEVGMAVLRQQFVLAETIETWIASLKKKFEQK